MIGPPGLSFGDQGKQFEPERMSHHVCLVLLCLSLDPIGNPFSTHEYILLFIWAFVNIFSLHSMH